MLKLLFIITTAYVAIFVMKNVTMSLDCAFNNHLTLYGLDLDVPRFPCVSVHHTKQSFISVLRHRENRIFPKQFVETRTFFPMSNHGMNMI